MKGSWFVAMFIISVAPATAGVRGETPQQVNGATILTVAEYSSGSFHLTKEKWLKGAFLTNDAEAYLAVWPASPGSMARAAEHLSARYPVWIDWNDNGVERELVITVNYCEYASFLANLGWFAGPRWQEVGRDLPR